MIAQRRVINRDGRLEVWQSNNMIAYVDPETDWLCVLGECGHVVARPDFVYHESQVLAVLDAWNKMHE